MVEKDSKLVFVIGEGDVNQVKALKMLFFLELVVNSTKVLNAKCLNLHYNIITVVGHDGQMNCPLFVSFLLSLLLILSFNI